MSDEDDWTLEEVDESERLGAGWFTSVPNFLVREERSSEGPAFLGGGSRMPSGCAIEVVGTNGEGAWALEEVDGLERSGEVAAGRFISDSVLDSFV